MAVYEQTYKRYTGQLTPQWSRFLIIPRHAYRGVFKSKIFTAFFVICFVPLLVEAILIYLHHNMNALGIMQLNIRELVPIDASFFLTFVSVQSGFAFFVTVLVGPPLVSRDLRNNALPLYLCRPFSRTEYVVGKMSVLFFLLSLMTWVPQLLLFFFQASLEGFTWLKDNLWIASAIFIGSVVWLLLLALISQAVSAFVKWRVIASAAILGLFFIPSVFAEFINLVFMTHWGNLVSLLALMKNVYAGLFGLFTRTADTVRLEDFDGNVRQVIVSEPPLWLCWGMLFLVCAICLALLSRKVKAYEVVR
jgi:ABC-type transport system involved in multi-copper enzyme maturation permease subunit